MMKNLSILFRAIVLFSLVTFVSACSNDDDNDEPQTLTELAAATPELSTLVDALTRTGLDATLNGAGPFTVFAPTNQAFQDLGVNLDDLTDAELTDILLYHVFVGQALASTAIAEGQTYLQTASESGPGNERVSALVERAGSAVTINGDINVTSADNVGTNGVVHIISKVMQPLDVVGHAIANSEFTSLVGALGDASGDLVNTLQTTGPFTVFAPVNSAFTEIEDVVMTLSADALRDILLYHVANGNVVSGDLSNNFTVTTLSNDQTFTINISGNDVTITDGEGNTASIVLTDVQATNGVIHVLNKVILP
ncbi:MAG: fasciclin domain-containing protein [Bacteroidota bacterium]